MIQLFKRTTSLNRMILPTDTIAFRQLANGILHEAELVLLINPRPHRALVKNSIF